MQPIIDILITDTLTMTCSRCGMSAREAFLLAMLRATGTRTSREPIKCDDATDHDFQPAH